VPFLRIGLPVSLITLAIATAYVSIRYIAL
jgi:hypothetical protein